MGKPEPEYRTAAWLGGLPFAPTLKAGQRMEELKRVSGWITRPDGSTGLMSVDVADLDVVLPPSIDDPVMPWPFRMGGIFEGGRIELDGTEMWTVLKVDTQVVVGARVELTTDGLRQLARAFWQRANALEELEREAVGPDGAGD